MAAVHESPGSQSARSTRANGRSARYPASKRVFENWLRIGSRAKKANYINTEHSLGKREVVSSILTGSTRNS